MSAGVAVFPAHGASGMAVLHVADAALYQAKTEGRDRVVEAVTPTALLELGRSAKKG
jgi:GGDEF domain-containing protein